MSSMLWELKGELRACRSTRHEIQLMYSSKPTRTKGGNGQDKLSQVVQYYILPVHTYNILLQLLLENLNRTGLEDFFLNKNN